ncbi:MAG: hypothetical protein AAF170_04270 [Bacteroidota bacterium]
MAIHGANTRAFYRGLRGHVRAAGRSAAQDAADEQVRHATTTTADGQHLGGWQNQSRRLQDSIHVIRDAARSTPDHHHFVLIADPRLEGAKTDYTVHLERKGFWVITGLGERARLWFRQLVRRRFREGLD